MAQVEWTEQAIDDLDAACKYIARDAPRSADLVAARIVGAVARLEEFPRSGRVVPEVGRDDIREIIVRNYRIIYRLRSDLVEIVTVHHGARRLEDPDSL